MLSRPNLEEHLIVRVHYIGISNEQNERSSHLFVAMCNFVISGGCRCRSRRTRVPIFIWFFAFLLSVWAQCESWFQIVFLVMEVLCRSLFQQFFHLVADRVPVSSTQILGSLRSGTHIYAGSYLHLYQLCDAGWCAIPCVSVCICFSFFAGILKCGPTFWMAPCRCCDIGHLIAKFSALQIAAWTNQQQILL